jgi:hypothetical protein
MVRVRITHSLFQEHEPGPPRERQRLLDQGLEPEILPGYILEVRLTFPPIFFFSSSYIARSSFLPRNLC